MATFPLHLRHIQEHANSERCQRILAKELNQQPTATKARAAGDRYVLRGIPVVGVPGGIGGAIIGTTP